jgi:ribosome-binding protein aMBF1 (putative translation factor)
VPTKWSEIKKKRTGAAVRAGYERARRAYELGQQVRAMRLDRGLTQGQLAEKVGTSQAAIARLEAGGVEPTLRTLETLAHALGGELVVSIREPQPA